MIELYHTRDAICPFKVRLALAEKGLEWTSRLITDRELKTPDYLKVNPKGIVPTLVHDGRVLFESRIISEYLEDAFPKPALMPADALGRHAARLWSKQIDDSLHLNIFVLSFVALDGWGMNKMDEETRQRVLPKDPMKRDIALDVLRAGIDSKWVPIAIARFRTMALDMEQALRKGTWLAGDGYSLADADFTAYVHRLDQMTLAALWADLPAVGAWFARVRSRPSYKTAILDWMTPGDNDRYTGAAQVRNAATRWLAAHAGA